ncbi:MULTISPECIES: copper amine oxidase N-terminal domain-containing protein [unclassified Paenibacillus]|uniref:copper amine oxidase N-terminal domain-containing protein n=1 Tax=unclassified Paenibacillus TaxID=185978 RepID=UPI001C9893E4|nr:copper amine oxidase N-terminal domain-containing protein [Paenibacillus sp. DR312]QZN76198.1 copper amine oxidase N-terminal domain-containing protein [Paenibacillus sp. DR312]
MKKIKIVASCLSAMLLMSVSVQTSSAAETKNAYTIEVNGTTLTQQMVVAEGVDSLSVPIAPIVKATGDSIKWNNNTQTAIIRQKDAVIEISANKTTIKLNGKSVPLVTKTMNNVIVPSGEKSSIIDGKLYVPLEAAKTVFGYDIKLIGAETKKLDLSYPVPSEWVLPQMKSSATGDYQTNRKILEDELGFQRGIWYNPYGQDAYEGLGKVRVGLAEGAIANIDFLAWYGDKNQEHVSNTIPYVSRELFRFYLPKEYDKLFKVMNDGYNGKDISKYINKSFKLDGRKITITENERSVTVKISKK